MGARAGKKVKETLLALYKNYKEKMEPRGSKSKVLHVQEVSDVEQKSASPTDLKRETILAKYKKQKAHSLSDGNIQNWTNILMRWLRNILNILIFWDGGSKIAIDFPFFLKLLEMCWLFTYQLLLQNLILVLVVEYLIALGVH